MEKSRKVLLKVTEHRQPQDRLVRKQRLYQDEPLHAKELCRNLGAAYRMLYSDRAEYKQRQKSRV